MSEVLAVELTKDDIEALEFLVELFKSVVNDNKEKVGVQETLKNDIALAKLKALLSGFKQQIAYRENVCEENQGKKQEQGHQEQNKFTRFEEVIQHNACGWFDCMIDALNYIDADNLEEVPVKNCRYLKSKLKLVASLALQIDRMLVQRED